MPALRPRAAAALRASRVAKYRLLSTCPNVSGSRPRLIQPVLFAGPGLIRLGRDVEFGWQQSVGFWSSYGHVEASTPVAVVEIGDGAEINNGAFIKSEGAGIRIGARALLGSGVTVIDSDFHELHPTRRRGGTPSMAPVELGDNVFIGDGVRILKGVTIGTDTVVGAGSVVTKSLPAGVIAAGHPARVLRSLSEQEDPRSDANPEHRSRSDRPAVSSHA